MKTISIIGTGIVGQTLASKFITLGYDVMIGSRNMSERLESTRKDAMGNPSFSEWYAQNRSVKLGNLVNTVAFSDTIMNCTPGAGSVNTLKLVDTADYKGKILIDVSNPLDFSKGMPPSLIPEYCNTNSLGESIQNSFPDARVVKALNTTWCGLMVNPGLVNNGDHSTFICGNDASAKEHVKGILMSFGWQEKNIIDLGDITAARAVEMYLPLWARIFGATKNGTFNIKIEY